MSQLIEKIKEIAQKNTLEVIGNRHHLHQNPELSYHEVETQAYVLAQLNSMGIQAECIANTGLIAKIEGKNPTKRVVALRADMDALPIFEANDVPYKSKREGVMHACGHDGHTAILMGVAEILAGMKKDLKGTVKFIFQPAEEGAPKGEEGGAELMIKEGVLENPKVDVVFGLHLDSQLEVDKLSYHPAGTFAGSGDFKITVIGKPSHGSQPWHSVDPIFVASQIVISLQQIVSRNVKLTENAAVVTVGAINGGNRSNIIPEQVEMLGTVRTFTDADETLVFSRVKQIAEKTAEAAGATALV